MKRRILRVMFFMVSLIASAFMIQKAHTQQTTISVSPTLNIYERDHNFTVQIWINDVFGLHGWEAKVRYDTSTLTITSVRAGPFLGKNGVPTYFAKPPPPYGPDKPIGGLITIQDWVDGSGIVAYIDFNVTDTGKSEITPFETTMLDVDSNPIDYIAEKGVFYTRQPHAEFQRPPYPWHGPQLVFVDEAVTFNATAYTDGLGNYRGSYDSDGNITEYFWNFGDGSTPVVGESVSVVYHTYNKTGSYLAQLMVADNNTPEKFTDLYEQYIDAVYEKAQVNFTYSPKTVHVGEEVTFDASRTTRLVTSNLSYTWNFGDGSPPQTIKNPTIKYTYIANGTYPVTLRVTASFTTADGGYPQRSYYDSNWNSTTVLVQVLLGIYANFTYSPHPPYKNEAVTFDAHRSSSDPLDPIINYTWDFEDGTPPQNSSSPTIKHTYSQNGTYTVRLNVTTQKNCENSTSLPIEVLLRPYANFTYSPKPVHKAEIVTFDATASSIPPPDQITSYIWDFGDGNKTTGDPIITHTYVYSGNYNATLTVKTGKGAENSTYSIINVSFTEPPSTHDVGIIWNSVTLNTTEGYVWYYYYGWVINITVTVRNEGTEQENFTITTYRKDTPIGVQPITNLVPNATMTVTFLWRLNNLSLLLGYYRININVTFSADQYPADNNCTAGTVQVKGWGDIKGDGRVNYKDLYELAIAYGKKRGDPNWIKYQIADIDGDGKVNYKDLYILAIYYGKSYSYTLDP